MPNMRKGGDVAQVHPDLVKAMAREGWELVTDEKPATAPKSEGDKK